MENNYLHNAIIGEFSQNAALFDGPAPFQLLCHYGVLASPNPPDKILDTLDINEASFARWLNGVQMPLILARSLLAQKILHMAKEADFSVTPYAQAFKPALSELFARCAADLTHPKLFQLACNVAHSYDADIDRKVSDEFAVMFPTISRWREGRSVPHLLVRQTIIKGIGELLSP